MELTRDKLRFERFVACGRDRVTVEGEATLPGSMRDAVTVLSVQGRAYIADTQAGMGEAAVRGRIYFQVLYTQGDLTRIRTLETHCAFEHTARMEGVEPGMRVAASAYVIEAEGTAASGRMKLRAVLEVEAEVFEEEERELITDAACWEMGLQTMKQTLKLLDQKTLSTGKALVREEYDLPERLGVGEVLFAAATAEVKEYSGGNGKIGVSGVAEIRVLHRPKENGEALVTTVHEAPFEIGIDALIPEGAQISAEAEVIDVMADSTESDKGRVLRVEAEVRVTLRCSRTEEKELLQDLYSTEGPVLEPVYEELSIHTAEERAEARESVRIQAALPTDAPPIGKMLAAFAQPLLTKATPAGRRLDAEGVMDITMIYLPADSDIPYTARTKEPFFMTFPVEMGEGASVHAHVIETGIGPSTSDRTELRCVLGLRARRQETKQIRAVADVMQTPEQKQEKGFVLVWPQEGESRWETARRLRVPQSSLRPAGKRALLAFRK